MRILNYIRIFIAKVFQVVTYWPTYLLLRFFVHFEVEGQENLKGLDDKPIIFASNHSYYLDSPMVAATMPRGAKGMFPWKFFPIRFLAYKEFFSWKNRFIFPISIFVMLYVRINGSLSVTRAKGDLAEALKDVIPELLHNGAKVWIYPEGKMSRDGELQLPGKRGTAYLHQETKAPIVPVGISGTFGLSILRFFSRKKKVKLKIGKPIYSLGEVSLEQGMEIVMGEIGRLMV